MYRIVIAVLLLANQGFALNCYQCGLTTETGSCSTGSISAANLQACPAGFNYCTTLSLINQNGGGSSTTTRGCSATPQAHSCIGAFGFYSCTGATCATDGCNSGTVQFVTPTGGGAGKKEATILAVVLSSILSFVVCSLN
uniref:Uncharacterized LOC100177091 n=1 Tax=Ciona intestinalis TaxID=7719 RepID=F6ZQF4_CIOIN|nr:uncharacterized protein LOC100177091 [Ciona intestinalis]|eukprot:XP_002131006.3 uncharacterized protein LOC100177091 [Ciona intestinalis]